MWCAVLFHRLILTPQIEDLQQLVLEVMILFTQWLLLLNLFFKSPFLRLALTVVGRKKNVLTCILDCYLFFTFPLIVCCILVSCIWKWFAQGRVSQKLSSRGKYVSVKIGPIRVLSSEQVMRCPLNFECIFTGEITSPLGFYIY
jgi:hypothetical protein